MTQTLHIGMKVNYQGLTWEIIQFRSGSAINTLIKRDNCEIWVCSLTLKIATNPNPKVLQQFDFDNLERQLNRLKIKGRSIRLSEDPTVEIVEVIG